MGHYNSLHDLKITNIFESVQITLFTSLNSLIEDPWFQTRIRDAMTRTEASINSTCSKDYSWWMMIHPFHLIMEHGFEVKSSSRMGGWCVLSSSIIELSINSGVMSIYWPYLTHTKLDWSDSRLYGKVGELSTAFIFWVSRDSNISRSKTDVKFLRVHSGSLSYVFKFVFILIRQLA